MSFVLPRDLNKHLALSGIMTARLFDVDMLAVRATQDGRWGMPVIASGNDHGIDIFVFEDASKISDGLRVLVW